MTTHKSSCPAGKFRAKGGRDAGKCIKKWKVKKGGLDGWKHTQATVTRRRHLQDAVGKLRRNKGYSRQKAGVAVGRRLTLLYTWNKNKNPALARLACRDYLWVRRTYVSPKRPPRDLKCVTTLRRHKRKYAHKGA